MARQDDGPKTLIGLATAGRNRRLPAIRRHLNAAWIGGQTQIRPHKIGSRPARPSRLLHAAVIVVTLVLLVRAVLVEPFAVTSGSMAPTLIPGDRVLVNKLAYAWHRPRRGDVVVFHAPDGGDRPLVKRVAALPGETVRLRDGFVWVDDRLVQSPVPSGGGNSPDRQWRLGPGEYFVLGDNVRASEDSRHWTRAVTRRHIIGRPLVRYLAWQADAGGGFALDWRRVDRVR